MKRLVIAASLIFASSAFADMEVTDPQPQTPPVTICGVLEAAMTWDGLLVQLTDHGQPYEILDPEDDDIYWTAGTCECFTGQVSDSDDVTEYLNKKMQAEYAEPKEMSFCQAR